MSPPALKESALAKVQFWIAAAGSLVSSVGAILIANQMGSLWPRLGSALAIIGAVLLSAIFCASTAYARAPKA